MTSVESPKEELTQEERITQAKGFLGLNLFEVGQQIGATLEDAMKAVDSLLTNKKSA